MSDRAPRAERREGFVSSWLRAAVHNGVDTFVRDGFGGVNTPTKTASFVVRTNPADLPETESL